MFNVAQFDWFQVDFLNAYWLVTVYLPPPRKNTWTWSDDIWDGPCLKFRVKVEFLCDVER